MKPTIFAIVFAALLILSGMCATAAATYDPIEDNGMKAYVWYSTESNWEGTCTRIAGVLSSQGFEVILHGAPNQTTVLQTIADEDVKIYLGMGHGCDWDANTGNGMVYATDFGETVSERESPLTIGVFQHCGSYLCYTPGRWLQECTQGNDDVVAQRFYGEGWCGDGDGDSECSDCEMYLELLGITRGYGTDYMWRYLDVGYTYEDAVNICIWSCAEGRKQGNRDLRYPQFCGDVNYDKIVNTADVTLLQMHLIAPSTYPIHSEWDADVNGDGSVDNCDAMLLELHVNSPEEFPLCPRGWFVATPPVIESAGIRRNVVTIRGDGFGRECEWSSVEIYEDGVPIVHDIISWCEGRVVCWCEVTEADFITITTLNGMDSSTIPYHV